MSDQPGAPIEQAQPSPQEKATVVKIPEIKKQYDDAARVGKGILEVNKDREEQGYAFSLKPGRIPQEFIQSVRSRGKDEALTESDIVAAKRGSAGVSLEASRQIKEGDLERTGKGDDDINSLIALRGYVSDGSKLYDELAQSDKQGVEEITRKIISQQLSVPPQEVKMTPEQMKQWAKENYDFTTGKLGKIINALNAYLSA